METEISSGRQRIVDELKELEPTEISDFLTLHQLYEAVIKEVRTKLEILDDEFSVRFSHNPIHHMEYRLKSVRSIIEKLQRKNLAVSLDSVKNNLYDVAGIRVICNYIDDVYRIADLLINQDDITLVRTRDYIKEPKPNGYRSLHLVLSVPIFLAEKTVPMNIEVQIRTIAMDFWASLDHQLRYKNEDQVSSKLKDRLVKCADVITAIDIEMQSIYKELKEGNTDE